MEETLQGRKNQEEEDAGKKGYMAKKKESKDGSVKGRTRVWKDEE